MTARLAPWFLPGSPTTNGCAATPGQQWIASRRSPTMTRTAIGPTMTRTAWPGLWDLSRGVFLASTNTMYELP